jgi:HEAT repeat protein
MRYLVVIALAVFIGGCGKNQPMLAGGKPVSYWVGALRDPDPRVRRKAAFKLGNVGQADPAVFPALLGALGDRDPGARREAILALLKCGPRARDALPTLTELQQHDRDTQVRACAARAVSKLQSER